MQTTLTKSKICAVKDQVSSNLGDETVILHVKTGSYYGLNEIGTRIWNLIQEPQAFGTVRDIILSEYNVSQPQLESDLKSLFNDLLKKGLVEIKDETVA